MDLGFTVYVNSPQSEEDLLRLLVAEMHECTRNRGYVKHGPNVLKFEDNFDYDDAKSGSSVEPWQYYRYLLDVFPVEPTDAKTQDETAMQLVEILRRSGAKAVIP